MAALLKVGSGRAGGAVLQPLGTELLLKVVREEPSDDRLELYTFGAEEALVHQGLEQGRLILEPEHRPRPVVALARRTHEPLEDAKLRSVGREF